MPVHEVAARGFGAGAELYEQSRPSYPRDAVAHISRQLGIGPGTRVCDLAAGTGKFTRLLLDSGATVFAIEPVEGMHAVLRRELASVPAAAAIAEALPLRTTSLDAVIIAQAFHWFDAPAALAEIARVLAVGGGLALVWNVWDVSVAWVDRVQRIVDNASATPEWRRASRAHDWVVRAIDDAGRFSAVDVASFRHEQTLTYPGVVDRVASTSHIVSGPEAERARVLGAVQAVLDEDPTTSGATEVEFPYVVNVYMCERL